ncbi:hypothetical protein F2Q70_00021435 [Brassica cretica]|uniref:Uncharacterized protein n=2 Tax=Brassica cretica TaxID=69181 RepID=A0A8S9GHW7_BRACR|nr:hypothetical protein F2Q70_00021435 [Brassica cretica]KAF2556449.1 hypothetical protein F2Q68_00014984 [Brassica cretica]KAF3605618.1 hypothetical protein DY000_02047728 [Brassica cretica]
MTRRRWCTANHAPERRGAQKFAEIRERRREGEKEREREKIGALCGLLYRYIDGGLGIWQEAESPPCWSRGWLLIEELYGYLEICHCSVLGLRIWKSQQGRRHLIHGCMVIKGLSGLCVPSDWS